MRRFRLNPSDLPDLSDDDIDDLNRLLAGEEVADALTGTGLVVDTSPRPAQIAEVATARGIVEVPVKEAPAAQKPTVNEIAAILEDPNGFRSTEEAREYLTSRNLSASELRSLAKVLSVADASIKRIVDSTVGARVYSETILGLDLGRRSGPKTSHFPAELQPVVQAILDAPDKVKAPPAPTADEERKREKQRQFILNAREQAGLPPYPNEDELALRAPGMLVAVIEHLHKVMHRVRRVLGENVEPMSDFVVEPRIEPIRRDSPKLLAFFSFTDPNSKRGRYLRSAGFLNEIAGSTPGNQVARASLPEALWKTYPQQWVYFLPETTASIKNERPSESALLASLDQSFKSLRNSELELEG